MAALTMFFLLGTFVSVSIYSNVMWNCVNEWMNESKLQALFSMVFFDKKANNDGSESMIIGPQWWLFPAITIPLTILVFTLWVAWQRYRNRVDSESLSISDLFNITGPDPTSEKSPTESYQHTIIIIHNISLCLLLILTFPHESILCSALHHTSRLNFTLAKIVGVDPIVD